MASTSRWMQPRASEDSLPRVRPRESAAVCTATTWSRQTAGAEGSVELDASAGDRGSRPPRRRCGIDPALFELCRIDLKCMSCKHSLIPFLVLVMELGNRKGALSARGLPLPVEHGVMAFRVSGMGKDGNGKRTGTAYR
jgi:hypothetical protein